MIFEAGKTYRARSLKDSDSFFKATIKSRTQKTVTLTNGKRCKIYVCAEGTEFIMPLGKYSFAPSIYASKEIGVVCYLDQLLRFA